MMKMLLMTLLITVSCAGCKWKQMQQLYCGTISDIDPYERCVNSWTFKKCRCYMYDPLTMEHVSESYDMPLEHCDNLIGTHFEVQQTKLKPWENERRRAYNDFCGN